MSTLPIVFLHGIGGGPQAFSSVHMHLAQLGHRCISWAHPGYPWSTDAAHQTNGTAKASLDAVAEELEHWLVQQGFGQVALVGHSLGGMVALNALARQATQGTTTINAAVLAHTSPAFGSSEGAFQARFIAQRTALLDAGGSMVDLAASLVPALAGDQANLELVRQAKRLMGAIAAPAYRTTLQALVQFDARAALPSIRVPVLCLGAELDSTAPSAVLEKMAAKLPQGRFVDLPGLGHLAPMQSPERWAKAVHEFLTSVSTES